MCADAMETRSTLARQYAALFPALAEHYPDARSPRRRTRSTPSAAAEAWNAYGMTVLR